MITSKHASAALEAAQAKANELGVSANIAVLDDGTHLKAFTRMDGAVLAPSIWPSARRGRRSCSASPAMLCGITASRALRRRVSNAAMAAS